MIGMESLPEIGFAAFAIGSALGATLSENLRMATLFLWLCGIGVGGLYLSLGAELLSIVQWIVATLVGISLLFHSIMFGVRKGGVPWTRLVLALVVAGGFVAALLPGMAGISGGTGGTSSAPDLSAIGVRLAGRGLLALEALGLTLFLGIMGAGILSRPETGVEEEEET